MGFWITILDAIIIDVAFSFMGGARNGGRSGVGGSTTPPPPRLRASAPKTDFCENEFDDEIEDFDRMFGDGI